MSAPAFPKTRIEITIGDLQQFMLARHVHPECPQCGGVAWQAINPLEKARDDLALQGVAMLATNADSSQVAPGAFFPRWRWSAETAATSGSSHGLP